MLIQVSCFILYNWTEFETKNAQELRTWSVHPCQSVSMITRQEKHRIEDDLMWQEKPAKIKAKMQLKNRLDLLGSSKLIAEHWK